MKTNIITYKIDKNKLRNKIIDFECMTNQHTVYIFMNQKTASVFEEQHKSYIFGSKETTDSISLNLKEVYGHKIFIDDDLEFGEIDIR